MYSTLTEPSGFSFDFPHLFIKISKSPKKDFLSHTWAAITLIMTWKFYPIFKVMWLANFPKNSKGFEFSSRTKTKLSFFLPL